MNRLTHGLIALGLAFTLSACTGLGKQLNNPNEAVDAYLAEQQYSKAMEVIASVDRDNPDFESLEKKRKQILREIDQFESESIKLEKRYTDKNQWPEAIAIIDDAIKKLPASQRLIEARQQLIKDRDNYIKGKQLTLAVVQANSLPASLELLEAIEKAQPAVKSSKQAVLVSRGQMDKARQILLNQAKVEVDRKNWPAAKDYLTLASKLGSNQESRELLAHADKQINLKNAKADRSRQLEYIKKRDEKLQKLEQALTDKNYLMAKKYAEKLEPSHQQDKQVREALTHCKQTIQEEISRLTQKGQQLYTKGYIDQAIDKWQLALQLDPVNSDIQERLRRAETFQASIEKFK